MATFDSVEAIRKEVLKRMETAAWLAEDEVSDIVKEYNDKFYNEYTPVEYIRTDQLRWWKDGRLQRTGVKTVGNSCVADIFYNDGWDYTDDPDDRGWTTAEIVNANMYGGHKEHKTAVWLDTVDKLMGDALAYDILKKSLRKAGLPI